MKKIITLGVLGAASSLMALSGEFAYLYKDPRIMGMGGANVAVGGYSTSIFSNPAGLANIKKEHGFVVDILSLSVGVSTQAANIAQDFSDVEDGKNGQTEEEQINDLLAKYNGDVLNAQLSNYSAVSKNSDLFAWSVGLLAASDIGGSIHGNGSSSGGLVEVAGRGYAGVLLGAAKEYDTQYGKLDIGVGIKYISQVSFEGALTATDLTASDPIDDLREKHEKKASGFGVDLGIIYKPHFGGIWHPAVGMSLMNIGAMDMDDNYGKQPITVNVGVSVSPEVEYIDSLVLAIDYVDMFNANEVRIYDYTDTDSVVWSDYTDSDFVKRLRLGVGVGLYESRYFASKLNLGLYQGAYTAGLDLVLTVLKINFTTYEEQLGTGSFDKADRRYMAQLGIGW